MRRKEVQRQTTKKTLSPQGEAPRRSCDCDLGMRSDGRGACAGSSPSNCDDNDDSMAGRTKTKVKTTRTGKRGAATSHRSGQGFVPLAVRQSIGATATSATWTASSESPQAAFQQDQ